MIADTGGGLLHRPLDPADLADRVAELLRDPTRASQLGLNGQVAIYDRYHATTMARQTADLYRQLIRT
jgi:glycosyltransferase involved in cell wall biosynthesis